MKNKKTIMFVSSLLILIFHFWIYIFDRTSNLFIIEKFIRETCFIGVDIFFFLSSYSIFKSVSIDYKSFLISRFKRIYIPFILFVLLAAITYKWTISKTLLTLSGVYLFLDGGGSFLWFIPAIMLLYIILPIYKKIDKKHNILLPITTIILWLIFTLFNSQYTNYNEIFILTNRIPIILIGAYCAKYDVFEKLNKKLYIIITTILTILGLYILFKYSNISILNIKDLFYILGIPLILGIILITNLIPTNKIINKLGSITLELYAIQMIYGYKITSIVLSIVKNKLLTNIISITIILLISLIVNYIFNKTIYKGVYNGRNIQQISKR